MRARLGNKRERVDRRAIGPHLEHQLECSPPGLRSLSGQSIDQIEVDPPKAQPSRIFEQRSGLFRRLDAVDRLLHPRIEVLHTDRDTIESELTEEVDL